MKKQKVALLTGGNSSEKEIALASAATIDAALDRTKYDVEVIDVAVEGWYRDIADFDYAFVMIHGTPGEDGRISGLLDIAGIPYSCSGVASMVITFNKPVCKMVVADVKGINLAQQIVLERGNKVDAEVIAQELGLPLFVKPAASGSSYGVTKVKHTEDIEKAVQMALTEGETVLIEEAIVGREFGCGVVLTHEKTILLPVTEIVSHNDFFDYEAKYTAGMSDEITPAPISAELTARLQQLAKSACWQCGCRGVVRADFIVTADERVYLVEINAIPGMSAGSIVPKQLATMGMSVSELCDILMADESTKI